MVCFGQARLLQVKMRPVFLPIGQAMPSSIPILDHGAIRFAASKINLEIGFSSKDDSNRLDFGYI